jgi:twitching motility protein PilT
MEEITDLIAEGRDHYHSQTFDQHLMDLVKANTVEFQVAQAAANNPTDFDLKMNMFGDVRGQRPGGGAGGTSDLADEMTTMMGG